MELETKLKSESSRLKKKYESEQQDMMMQIDSLNRNNADLAKANKSLASKLKVNGALSLYTTSRCFYIVSSCVTRILHVAAVTVLRDLQVIVFLRIGEHERVILCIILQSWNSVQVQ